MGEGAGNRHFGIRSTFVKMHLRSAVSWFWPFNIRRSSHVIEYPPFMIQPMLNTTAENFMSSIPPTRLRD